MAAVAVARWAVGNYYSRVTFHIKMIYTSHLGWSAHFLSNFMPLLELLNSLLMIIHHTTLEPGTKHFQFHSTTVLVHPLCGMAVLVPYWKVGLILFHTPGIKYNYSDKVINYHPVSGLSQDNVSSLILMTNWMYFSYKMKQHKITGLSPKYLSVPWAELLQ